MSILCVDGAEVLILVQGAPLLGAPTASIPATSGNKLCVKGKRALTIKDIEAWLPNYLSDYINAAFVGGKAMATKVNGEQTLTAKVISKDPLLVKDSVIDVELTVGPPGQDPTPAPDPLTSIMVKLQFTNPGQTKADMK